MKHLTILCLALLAACAKPALPEIQPEVQCKELHGKDLPSRVIYEQTRQSIVPYLIPEAAKDGVFEKVLCINMRNHEIRGTHFNICEDELNWWEDINPYTHLVRTGPYEAGDTAWMHYWTDGGNFFHE